MHKATLLPGFSNLPFSFNLPDEPAAEGGQAFVYFTDDKQYAVKIYKNAISDQQKSLEKIIPLGKNLGIDQRYTAWPLGIVIKVDDRPSLGVVTRKVPYKPLDRVALTPHTAYKQFKNGLNWLNFLKISRSIAAATRSIHDRGVAHGDISLKNVLGDIQTGEATLIDLDGIIVPGYFIPRVSGTPRIMAPELYKDISNRRIAERQNIKYQSKVKPTKQTDLHSLGVSILWTLLFRNVMNPLICYDDEDEILNDALGFGEYACFSEHPKDKRNWFSKIGQPFTKGGYPSYRILSPHLQALTESTFIQGISDPSQRPEAREWEKALAECSDLLYKCFNCNQAFIYPYWKASQRLCPFCFTAIAQPFPSVIQLLEQQKKGVHIPAPIRTFNGGNTPIILYNGLPLFEDSIIKDSIPPFTRKGTRKIGTTIWDKDNHIHFLKNESDDIWSVITGTNRLIRKGEAIPLKKGVVISFGDGKRLMKVLE